MNKKVIITIVLLIAINPLRIYAQKSDSTKSLSIEEVTVSAYRVKSELGKIPQQLKIISEEEISSIPAKGLDDVLKKSTSIDLVQYPGFNTIIGFRGFAPSGLGKTNTLILKDGIPVGTSNLATINLEDASQVELLKGPYSAFFGSEAMAGAINIATRKTKDKIGGNISLAYGSFDTRSIKLNVGGKVVSGLSFDIYANYREQGENYTTGDNNLLKLSDEEKLIMDEKSYGAEYKNTKFKQYSVGGRLGYQINKDWEINLNQEYWIAKDIQTNGNFWGQYDPIGKDIDRLSQSLILEGKLGNHSLRFSPHYSIENTDLYNDVTSNNFQTNDNIFSTYGAILQDAISISEHQLIIGVDNVSKKFQSKLWATPGVGASPYQPDYLNMATGVYAQANINVLDNKLNATIGGRYDNIVSQLFETQLIESADATEKYNIFNPSFGIQYKIIKGLKVHAAGGTAFVAPNAFKLAGNYTSPFGDYIGNPDLKPESSITYDFGLTYTNRKIGLHTDLTYFTTKHKDMVVSDYSNITYVTFINADEANMDGLEIEFEYDFGALSNYNYSLKAYLSYTHMYNSKIKFGDSEDEMKYVRMNKASFGLMFNSNKGIAARLNARYIGQRNEDNWLYNTDWVTYERSPYLTDNGEEIRPSLINEDVIRHPDFLIMDLSVSYTCQKGHIIGITVDNLFNDNYSEKDAYYMPGRSVMGSVSFKF